MQDAIFWSSSLVSRSTTSRQGPPPSILQSCPAHELSALTASLPIRSVCAVVRIAQELRAVNSVPRRQCESGAGYCGKEHEDRPRPCPAHEGVGDFFRGEGHEVRAPITERSLQLEWQCVQTIPCATRRAFSRAEHGMAGYFDGLCVPC